MSERQTTPVLLTARQLAAMLEPYGDRPVKLRVKPDGGAEWIITLLEADAVSVVGKSAQDTAYGDMDVCRLDVEEIDNA